ncbi:hypothetical protein AA313_de0206195 [Arthrobotrys entomopaga]|nr:hypothetical protein AA313_de0206195 [Arthrobotrys entomopaga]
MRLVTVKQSASAVILYALVAYSLPSGNRAGPGFEKLDARTSEAISVAAESEQLDKRQPDTFIKTGLEQDLELPKRHEGTSNFANLENLKRELFPNIVPHHHEESSHKEIKNHGEVKNRQEAKNKEPEPQDVKKREPKASPNHPNPNYHIRPNIKEKFKKTIKQDQEHRAANKAAINERQTAPQANANSKRSYEHINPLQGYDNAIPAAAYSADDGSFAHSIANREVHRQPESEEHHAVRRAILEARLKELGYDTTTSDQDQDLENDSSEKKRTKRDAEPTDGGIVTSKSKPVPPKKAQDGNVVTHHLKERDAEPTNPDSVSSESEPASSENAQDENAPTHHLKKRDFDPYIGCPSLRLMNSGGSIFFNPDYFKSRMAEFRNACFKCGCKAKMGTWSMSPREDWGCTDRLVMNCILLGCMCVPDAEEDAKWLMPKPAWEAKSPASTSKDNHYSFEIYDPLKDISYGDRYSAEADVYETPIGTGLKKREGGEKWYSEGVSKVKGVFEKKRDVSKA